MDPVSQLLLLILQSFGNVLPGAAQNQTNAQQQAMQRQLSTSDMAQDPKRFMAQLSNMLGISGGSAGPNSGGPHGAGNNTFAGMLQALISKFTGTTSQNLTNNVWQQMSPQLASSGLSQSPGIANEEMTTALAPFSLQEQQLGAEEGQNALSTALQTQETNLGYPFKLGSGIAGQFPTIGAL